MARATTLQRRSSRSRARAPARASSRSRPNAARSRSRPKSRASGRATPRARRQAPGTQEIQGFLDGFVTEITAGDGQAAALRFEYPALMVMSGVGEYGGAQLLRDEATVAEVFAKAPAMYHAKGIEQTTAVIEKVEWVSDDLALVRVYLPYLDGDGDDMGDAETSVYLLRRKGDGDFAICSAITLGAESDRAATR
jgi:hypothetical protein